jgi:hypothetical protein
MTVRSNYAGYAKEQAPGRSVYQCLFSSRASNYLDFTSPLLFLQIKSYGFLSLPGIPKSSEQVVSKMLTIFLVWMPVACWRTVRALRRRRVSMVRTPWMM